MAPVDPLTGALLLATLVFAAFAVQAVTGFGAVILSLSVGALLLPMDVLLPVLVTSSTALNLWFFVRDRGDVDRRVLVRRVVPFMGTGVALGLLVGPWIETEALSRGFGVLVVGLALWQLAVLRRGAADGEPGDPRAADGSAATASAWLLGAGVVHGLVASGGPLLVHALQRERLSPRAFRATLLTIWLLFNVLILADWARQGRFTSEVVAYLPFTLPATALAVIAGDAMHRRLDAGRYRRVVYAVLLVSGVLLLVR